MPTDTKTLGEELHERRMALGMSRDDLSRTAHISVRYIAALEKSDYHIFPAKVYAHGALRRITHLLSPGDGDILAAMLNREWPEHLRGGAAQGAAGTQPYRRFQRTFLIPRKLSALSAAAFFLFFLFFLGFWGVRIFFFTAPPVLAITDPQLSSRSAGPAMVIAGMTERESRLTVNGREIRIDERGAFQEDIELPLGTNRLQFVSESRFGKTSTEVRYVLVE